MLGADDAVHLTAKYPGPTVVRSYGVLLGSRPDHYESVIADETSADDEVAIGDQQISDCAVLTGCQGLADRRPLDSIARQPHANLVVRARADRDQPVGPWLDGRKVNKSRFARWIGIDTVASPVDAIRRGVDPPRFPIKEAGVAKTAISWVELVAERDVTASERP